MHDVDQLFKQEENSGDRADARADEDDVESLLLEMVTDDGLGCFAAGLCLDQRALRGVLNVEFTDQVLHDNDRRVSVADAKAQTRLAVRQEADNGPRFLTGAAPNCLLDGFQKDIRQLFT